MTSHGMKPSPAERGYVYQYSFLETQARRRFWGPTGTAYLFHVSSGRKSYSVVEVLVEAAALQAWEKAHGRALVSAEQYAAAKMGLFRAMDESPSPQQLRVMRVDAANIDSLLDPLHLDD